MEKKNADDFSKSIDESTDISVYFSKPVLHQDCVLLNNEITNRLVNLSKGNYLNIIVTYKIIHQNRSK